MLTLINVLDIENRHRRTLKNYNEARRSGYDNAPYSSGALVLNYWLPLGIAIGFGIYFWNSQSAIERETVEVLISVFAIFSGFFLNVLVLMYRIAKDESPSTKEISDDNIESENMDVEDMENALTGQLASAGPKRAVVTELPRQAYSNVSYSILICVFMLVILIITSLVTNLWVEIALSVLIIFLLIHFVVTLLMVVKRMHAMLFAAP